MLVISRKPGEQVVVEPAGVRVVYLGPDKRSDGTMTSTIRIGIDADKKQKILRGEIVGLGRNVHPKDEDRMSQRGK